MILAVDSSRHDTVERRSEAYLEYLQPAYPLLVAKSQTRDRCERPHFTDEERQERKLVIRWLQLYKNIRRHNEELRQKVESEFSYEFDFLARLYLLARCGDEGALLELILANTAFLWSNLCFNSCLYWEFTKDNLAKAMLKSLAKVAQTVIDRPMIHRSMGESTPAVEDAIERYIEMKLANPERQDSHIYRQIARDSLKKEGKEVTPNEVKKRAEAIKKRVKRDSHLKYWRAVEYVEQNDKEWDDRKFPWPFQYLQREYEEEAKNSGQTRPYRHCCPPQYFEEKVKN